MLLYNWLNDIWWINSAPGSLAKRSKQSGVKIEKLRLPAIIDFAAGKRLCCVGEDRFVLCVILLCISSIVSFLLSPSVLYPDIFDEILK